MTNKSWSQLFGAFVILFSFVIPLAVTLVTYVSLETTTTKGTMSVIGVVIAVSLLFGLIKLGKKRIAQRKDMGFTVSPYIILALNNTFGLVGVILVAVFLNVVKGEIETLWTVMVIIALCETVAYILKFVQTHFDIKTLAEQQNP